MYPRTDPLREGARGGSQWVEYSSGIREALRLTSGPGVREEDSERTDPGVNVINSVLF